jgi:hypothetical protein
MDLAVAELARLASLTELSLQDCKSLGTAAAAALQQCCPQLQDLDVAGTGGSSPRQLMGTPAAAAHLTAVVYESTPRAVLTAIHNLPSQPWPAPWRCSSWPPSPA